MGVNIVVFKLVLIKLLYDKLKLDGDILLVSFRMVEVGNMVFYIVILLISLVKGLFRVFLMF